ncbi:MAG: nucleoside transporter, partial [Planctomycetes bacterium]|nr:nucleoside transporter [Planctomycetota bacterium]
MSTADHGGSVVKRLDRLYEFDREPVSTDKLCGGAYFAGAFAGEHVAATEFVIGALFVTWGAGVVDVVVGLAIGNLLAVLSWALVCAPIAIQTRLTLYWYLRKIGGPFLTLLYNVLNAILFCVLAGCMITVSASAVRIPFGIPAQTSWYPTDWRFVVAVCVVGAVVVTLAIAGFKRLAA